MGQWRTAPGQRRKGQRITCDVVNLLDIKHLYFPQELTEEQIHEITRSFEILDANKDGRISKSDVMKGSQLLGIKLTSEEAEAMIVAGDLDSDGFLSLQDYIQMMKERYVPIDINTARMEAAFEVIDKNKDGYISIKEFKEAVMYKDNTLSDNEIEIRTERSISKNLWNRRYAPESFRNLGNPRK